MKKLLGVVVALIGTAAMAQAADPKTGTIVINGTVGPMLAITNGADGALNETVDFGTIATDFTNTAVTAKTAANVGYVEIKLRSNVGYSVSGALSTTTATPGSVAPADINYVFTNLDVTGSKVFKAGSPTPNRTDTWAPVGASTTMNMQTGSLANFGTAATPILSGDRISNKGHAADPANAITTQVSFNMLPEFFTDGDFSYTLTLTMASP